MALCFPRHIVHLDADAFFASVEQASDPRLRGKPIAVGGEKRGIIASASYEARRFGIYTPMPTVMARRLCPKLILLPGDFEKYELFSRLMFSYAYDFTPDVEIGSIDEGYFDLTGAHKPAVGIAQTIRQAIRQSLKLSVSEGIAANKLVSQIASKLKKPSAFEFVESGHEAEFLAPLANKWLPGIGPKTAGQLNTAGLAFIGQIARTPVELLNLLVGNLAPQLRRFAAGIDERPVVPAHAPAKSYGEQETFAADTTNEEFLAATLCRMADKLMGKVREDGKSIRTVTVKVRYNDMDEQQAAESLSEPTDLEAEIYSLTIALLRKAWQRRVSLRLVSLRLSNVYEGSFRAGLALDTMTRRHDAQQRLAGAVDDLRQRFGRAVLLRGHDFVLRRGDCHIAALINTSLQRGGSACGNKSNRFSGFRRARPDEKAAKAVASPALPPVTPLKRGVNENELTAPSTPAPESAHARRLAIVERQRIGNSFARAESNFSPAPELRFRITAPQPPNPSSPSTHSSASRFTFHVSRSTHHASRIAHHVPLNLHSYYSFLDSTLSIKAIVELAKRHELPAIALTDKNNLHGAVEFAQTAAEAGIKPIIGAEVDWRGHKLCLYVQNQTGYQNLCRILNHASGITKKSEIRNPKSQTHSKAENSKVQNSRARTVSNISHSDFNTEGLLAASSSPALASLFPDRFYLGITSLTDYENLRLKSTTLSLHPSLPVVASFPVHYDLPSDRWKYDIVQSIRTLTLLRQEHPEKRLDGEYHFRPPTELQRLFVAHPELLANSCEIADRCDFTFQFGTPQFPSYPAPDRCAPADYLRRLVMEGLHRRYPKEQAARLKPQLEEELAIILEVGYEEYFLVMWDILQECRRRGIEWITRGSAADSLACYCLEISGVCPIRFDLYFRRFLNKERMALNKLPDIDVDFPHDRKDDVIDLIFEKYGPKHAAIVGGFSTFQSRSAFAEVAKVLGVSEYQVRRLTERLPHFSRASELAEATADSIECRDLPLQEEPYATALQMARFLDGFPRYAKMHPCGLVLSRQYMNEITPCFTSAKGYPTTHFDMDSVEAVGLVKMDILAQGGLAVMRDVEEMVKSSKSEIRDPKPKTNSKAENSNVQNFHANAVSNISYSDFGFRISDFYLPSPAGPFDDEQVWQLISSGNARAVHHIESPAMISLCKMCDVRDIDTLIAIVSVIRPGAANESKKMEFARRYQGLSPTQYPHPSLERCLRSTYGLVVYEEHILQICEAFADLPPGRADVLRRALGKNKTELIDQISTEFANCARKLGRTEAEIIVVWDLVVGFRGYAFCKAHSTAYGVEAYQSAWLKLHYPAQFMAAVLTNGKGFYSPLVYVLECHRLGISLLPPSVNAPGPAFTVEENQGRNKSEIRVPALQTKGLTLRTKETIARERTHGPFASLADFYLRVQPLPEEMEALIRVGAFDEFGQLRTAQYWEYKSLAACEGNLKAEAVQLALGTSDFDLRPSFGLRPSAFDLSEPTRLDRLRAEEELLGYPVSSHPLELYPDIAWETYCPVNRLGQHIGQQIVTCGLVIEQRLFHQVTGEPMKFITIADWTGIIETELFAKTYRFYGLNTIRYRVLEITATVEPFENGRGHTLRVLRAGKPRTKNTAGKQRNSAPAQ
jgi:DNA-directed DNA polymerase III PolC